MDNTFSAESKPVSEEDVEASPTGRPRRGTRACDRCRKIKSKCEPAGDKCKNCLAAGTQCTFQGPSFKRGPPKGYIHAIEQRWHQVECILGTIMASPRAQGIVEDLRQDPVARDVLDRVDVGPYGPSGRSLEPRGASQEGFYETIMNTSEQGLPYEDRRARRQSRLSREIVSSQDTSLPTVPTPEWQDQLIRRLASSTGSKHSSSVASMSPSTNASPIAVSSSAPGLSGEPGRRRLKVESGPSGTTQSHGIFDNVYSMDDPRLDDVKDTASAMGQLSMDENQEIRFHGQSAGLHLLAKSGRTDDSQQKENGIWKFYMPSMESSESGLSLQQEAERIRLPPVHVQDHLIQLYFTYVHPFFPVIHKGDFLENYNRNKFKYTNGYVSDVPPDESQREPMQKVNKLLLLSMFAFAVRYSEEGANNQAGPDLQSRRVGDRYAMDARTCLNSIYQYSRPSTCQALLLLCIREFGMGSMEQGWLYSGMATRMAVDLGMNRNADHWKDAKGNDLFNPVEKRIRKRIWWSCCISDKLASIWLGRPVIFREGDFDTPELEVEEFEEHELWQPYPSGTLGTDFRPMPGHILSCFREQARLSFIMSQIMTKIYPVKPTSDLPKRRHLPELDARLHNWQFSLPEHLQYSEPSRRGTPSPPVLILHIEYYSAVLLLHRAFLPTSDDEHDSDPLSMKAFDTCHGAATHISSLTTVFHQVYGLSRAPPLLAIYLQSAGIMHVVTLTRRPGNTQASIGLLQCIAAAQAMMGTWPGAARVRDLLKGVNVQLDDLSAICGPSHSADRPKRSAEEAMGADKNSDALQREFHEPPARSAPPPPPPPPQHQLHDTSRMTPHGLGVPSPGIHQPSASYMPGYEWWPQSTPGVQPYGSEGYYYPSLPMTLEQSGQPMSSMPPQHNVYPFEVAQGQYPQGTRGLEAWYPGLDLSQFPPTNHPR